MRFILIVLVLWGQSAFAGLPEALHPLVVSPPFSFSERVFDLGPAFARARQSHKPVLLYAGADDCPPCRSYSQFLAAHVPELAPAFDQFVLVELQTWLRGSEIIFLMNNRRYTVPQFKEAIGDPSGGLRFPTMWMLSEGGQLLKQLLPATGPDRGTVEGSLRMLSLP